MNFFYSYKKIKGILVIIILLLYLIILSNKKPFHTKKFNKLERKVAYQLCITYLLIVISLDYKD